MAHFTFLSIPVPEEVHTAVATPAETAGGVIDIEAGELLMDGGIYANGGSVSHGGGGSGGSILVHVTTLKGSGTVTANGGNSSNHAGGVADASPFIMKMLLNLI